MTPPFVKNYLHPGGSGIAVGAFDEYVWFSELFAAGVQDDEMDTTLTISCNCPRQSIGTAQQPPRKRLNSHSCWLREDIIAVCASIQSRELRSQHGQFFVRKVHSSASPEQLIAMVQPDPTSSA